MILQIQTLRVYCLLPHFKISSICLRMLHHFWIWWSLLLLFLYLYSTTNTMKVLNHSTLMSTITRNQPKHIFILAGQSNMAGRGGVNNKIWDGFVPQECYPNPSIRRLNSELTWEEAHEPLHSDIDSNKTCGIGPGMVFANKILHKYLVTATEALLDIGLVPCAVGGTSLSEWSLGSKLYNDLIRRARAAMEDDDDHDDHQESILEAVLWFQGERDTITIEEAESYKTKLEKLIQDLRNDLQSPNLPFFQVLLASAQGPFMDMVREAQMAINLLNVISVEAKGLPLQPDVSISVHWPKFTLEESWLMHSLSLGQPKRAYNPLPAFNLQDLQLASVWQLI